jgi:hypothetical protein
LLPSLILVGDQAPRRKDDGTDFGCVLCCAYGNNLYGYGG